MYYIHKIGVSPGGHGVNRQHPDGLIEPSIAKARLVYGKSGTCLSIAGYIIYVSGTNAGGGGRVKYEMGQNT